MSNENDFEHPRKLLAEIDFTETNRQFYEIGKELDSCKAVAGKHWSEHREECRSAFWALYPKLVAAVNALPGLLDEVERGRRAEEVLRVAGDYDEVMAQADQLDAQAKRIAQLEAALREICDYQGAIAMECRQIARAALDKDQTK